MSGPIVGLVPIRGFDSAKTRLAGALSASERASITQWMLEGVIVAALGVEALAELAVISPDPRALAFARAIDDRVIPIMQRDDEPGLNPAVTSGRDWAIERGAAGLLVLFGDLPSVAPADVERVVRSPAQVVVATDRHGTGTNASLVRFTGRGPEFRYQYGQESAQRHETEAARLGLTFEVVSTPGIAFDLDTPDDLASMLARGGEGVRQTDGGELMVAGQVQTDGRH